MANYGFNKDLNSFWKLKPKGTIEDTESARIHRFVRFMDEKRPFHNSQNYRRDNFPHFTSTVTAYTSPILITEAVIDTPDYVEIQNISPSPFIIPGWQLVLSNSQVNINLVNAITKPITPLLPGDLLYWSDNAPDPNYWGNNINWSAAGNGWIMIIDALGNVMDFVSWGWSESDIRGMSINVGAFVGITVPETQWSSDGIPTVSGNYGIKRVNSLDTNQKSDWDVSHSASESSVGVTNPELIIPFRNHTGI